MKIIFASAHADPDCWMKPLQALIPAAEIHPWLDGGPSIDAQLAIVWNPPQDLFLRESGLKAVFNLGAGVDAVVKLPGLAEDVAVIRLEDAGMSAQMAEYAVYALVRASRQFDEYEMQQQQQLWRPLANIKRKEWKVGVMGMGVMGARVAQTLAGLDYPVAGWSRSAKQIPGIESYSGEGGLPVFLARTRVLINLLPLTADTTGILCRNTLAQLPGGAYIINLGRGEHLVEEDLLALLDSGHLRGATLDVFRQEPLPKGHPFWRDRRITITPHTAAASLREETIEQVAGKIRQYMAGETLTGVVLRDRGY